MSLRTRGRCPWTRTQSGGLGVFIVVLTLAGCTSDSKISTQPANPLAGDAIYADVETYTNIGVHRTGSEGDLATGAWLASELRSAGFDVEAQRWIVDQFYLEDCVVELGETEVECFPFWQPRSTAGTGVRATAVHFTHEIDPENLRGRIAFLDSEIVGGNHFKLGVAAAVLDSDAVAAVYVIASDTGELVAQNAIPPFDRQALPIPAVIVAQKDEEAILRAVERGNELGVRINGEVVADAEAFNVVGTLERGPRWVVVSTPISGWFGCGGERGPGVAMWLALARWAAESDSNLSFLFVGTSGHELDYMGAHHFAASGVAPSPADVVVWLHLGASIGTRLWEGSGSGWRPLATRNPGNLVGSPELAPILEAAFEGVPALTPRSGESKGELRVVLEHGYRAFGFYGGHPWFHTPRDVAESTEPAFLEPIARAVVQALETTEESF